MDAFDLSVDRDDGRLYHYQQFALFRDPEGQAVSPIARMALGEGGLADYGGKIAFHNLDFFAEFARDLRQYAVAGKSGEFVTYWLKKPNVDRLRKLLPELFQ